MATSATTILLEVIHKLESQVFEVIEQIPEEKWQNPTPKEQWPIGFTVRHIGTGVDNVVSWIKRVLAQQPIEFRPDQTAEFNAAFLSRYDKVSKATEVARLKHKFEELEALVRNLEPEQLHRVSLLVAFDLPVNVAFIVTNLLSNHTLEHLESLRQALAA